MRRNFKPLNKFHLNFFRTIMNQADCSIKNTLRLHDINPTLLYKLINSEDILQRRDEFYALFKTEDTADIWWSKVTDWKLETEDGIFPLYKEDDEEEC